MPNSFFDRLASLFFKAGRYDTGLLLDDPSTMEGEPQYDLIFGGRKKGYIRGAPQASAKDWSKLMPPFRNQGASRLCTAFAGTDVASAFEKVESASTFLFSPLELFFRASGSIMGNSLMNTAKAMTWAVVAETDVPTPPMYSWNYNTLDGMAKASAMALDKGRKYAMKSYVFVTPDRDSVCEALKSSPIYAGIGIGRGYWSDPAPVTWNYGDYHAVVITAVDSQGCYVIKDSIAPRGDFDGFHRLAPDYPLFSAIAFVDLPDDWQAKQESAKNADYAFCLSHYGKMRDFKLEQKIAAQLSDASRRNPTVASYIGQLFTVLINAVAYGRFTITDILNHFTSIRRGQGPIFDWNGQK